MPLVNRKLNRVATVPQDSGPNEVDLHGLFVKEAIEYTERAIQEAQRRGDAEIHLIVGTFSCQS